MLTFLVMHDSIRKRDGVRIVMIGVRLPLHTKLFATQLALKRGVSVQKLILGLLDEELRRSQISDATTLT
jgi:hypothetical protein